MNLKKLLLSFMVLFGFCAVLSAQVSMEIVPSQKSYLQYEPVFVTVAFRNFSAHPLTFGKSKGLQGKLYFDIRLNDPSRPKIFPIKSDKLPNIEGNIIPPGATIHLTFKLSQYYDLRRLGNYSITAVLAHPQLKTEYESTPKMISVVKGNKIWETTAGVPDFTQSGNPDTTKKIKTRRYSIYSYFNGRNGIYALIIDDDNSVYAVKRIGFDMGPTLKPKCEVDLFSRIHIMIPASPKVFAYYRYNSDGTIDKKQIFIKTSTTPSLVVNHQNGSVTAVGGREARRDVDYEEIKDLPFMEKMDEDFKNDFQLDDTDEPEEDESFSAPK